MGVGRVFKGLKFVALPESKIEQYGVFDSHNHQVGHVQLEHGVLECMCPDAWGDIVYRKTVANRYSRTFRNENQRVSCLVIIAGKIQERIGIGK